ncbi:MAG: hypothetical protein ACYSW3_02270 [Planctomycetota bacterium]|jgi:hypothetical protein
MATKQKKQGKHKKYGPKMAHPRIARSKEHRQCGPLGYAVRLREKGKPFSTRARALRS